MKHCRRNLIQIFVLVLLGISVILTLLYPTLSVYFPKRVPIEISVIVRDSDNALLNTLRMGMEQAASDQGAELRFLIPTSANSAKEQEELLQREAERGTDSLIVMAADSQKMQKILEEMSVQLPYITLESSIKGERAYFSPDNCQVGQQLAQAALEADSDRKVMLINSCPSSQGFSERVQAAQEILENAGVQVILWTRSDSRLTDGLNYEIVRQKVGKVIAFDGASTQKISEYYAQRENRPELYGVGCTGEIVAGLEQSVLSAIAVWSEYAAGYMAVEEAIHSVRGEHPDSKESLRFSIVRGDEIYESENQKLLFPVTS